MKKLLKEKNFMWLAIAALAFCTIKPLVTKGHDMKRRGARMECFERSHERGPQMRGKEQTGRKERSTQKKKPRYNGPPSGGAGGGKGHASIETGSFDFFLETHKNTP